VRASPPDGIPPRLGSSDDVDRIFANSLREIGQKVSIERVTVHLGR
jgi:hypothetical protein